MNGYGYCGRVPTTQVERDQARTEEMYEREDKAMQNSRFEEAPVPVEQDDSWVAKLADARQAIQDALCRVGGALFESQVYFSLHRYSDEYRAILEFRGWPPALSVPDVTVPLATLLPSREAFSHQISGPELDQVVGQVLDIINGWSFAEPETVSCSMTTETYADDGFLRYFRYTMPDGRTLVRRFQKIGDGPWFAKDYPNRYMGTIVL